MNQLDKRILKDCLDKVKAILFYAWPKRFGKITIRINRVRKAEPEVFYDPDK